jgi:hypothetical protein
MWITFNVCILMMLAMYCYPLFGSHASSEPQPETHEMTYYWVKFYTSMTLTAM